MKRERIKNGVEIDCDSCGRRCNDIRYYCPLGETQLHEHGCNVCVKCKNYPSAELVKKANDKKMEQRQSLEDENKILKTQIKAMARNKNNTIKRLQAKLEDMMKKELDREQHAKRLVKLKKDKVDMDGSEVKTIQDIPPYQMYMHERLNYRINHILSVQDVSGKQRLFQKEIGLLYCESCGHSQQAHLLQ